MTTIPAGARVLASEINAALPIYGRCTTDTTKTSSTTLGDVTGFAIALEASSTYVMDGYIGYTAGATGDLKIAWSVPTGTTGHWCPYGLSTASTGGVGDLDARRITAYGDANTASIGGSDSPTALGCLPRLFVVTDTTAGDMVLRFAQNTSSGTSTIIRVGTWIRAVKVA
jgi:hypothetical protein